MEIKRVEDDANLILPGDAFIARKGNKSSGISYIDSALEKGAAAIVVDDENYFNEADLPVPIIWVPNCLSFIAYASAKIYNFPAEALTVIAVTGTNGKTTVTHFIGQILNQLDKRTMVIGTNGVFIDQEKCYPEMEALTTLQAKNIQFLFKEAIRLDVPYVVLEASSIGLEKHRLDHCDIDIG
ncbi:MAG: Mur ligase family protein, partial [Solibacillus sp.]